MVAPQAAGRAPRWDHHAHITVQPGWLLDALGKYVLGSVLLGRDPDPCSSRTEVPTPLVAAGGVRS